MGPGPEPSRREAIAAAAHPRRQWHRVHFESARPLDLL